MEWGALGPVMVWISLLVRRSMTSTAEFSSAARNNGESNQTKSPSGRPGRETSLMVQPDRKSPPPKNLKAPPTGLSWLFARLPVLDCPNCRQKRNRLTGPSNKSIGESFLGQDEILTSTHGRQGCVPFHRS